MKLMPPKIIMSMENPPFEDIFPIEHGDFPASRVSVRECRFLWILNIEVVSKICFMFTPYLYTKMMQFDSYSSKGLETT